MERKFCVNNIVLNKLADPDKEIRRNALGEVTLALKNNILFVGSQGQNSEDLSFVNVESLVRHLICWFKYLPITNEDEVLDLLILIFTRRDFLRHVVKCVNLVRLKKEVDKIIKRLETNEGILKAQSILQILADYESSISIDSSHNTRSFADDDSEQSSLASLLNEKAEELSRDVSTMSLTSSKCAPEKVAKEEFWAKLDGLTLDVFNGIDAELVLCDEEIHLSNVINFLQASLEDYPPEFFVQSPNICEKLIKLALKGPKNYSIKILGLVQVIIYRLKRRWNQSLNHTNQKEITVSLKNSINNILLTLNCFFDSFHDNFSLDFVKTNQEVLNEIYFLLFGLSRFISETQNVCIVFLNNLMNSMGNIIKILRTNYSSGDARHRLIRIHYLINILLINVFIASIKTINVSAQCGNNVWEYECDMALLDVPLKESQPHIYSLLVENRKDVIRKDEELTLLLESQSSWKPFVELCQNHETLPDEAIIFKGLEAISAIRIHRSLELVDVLMTSIGRFSASFSNNKKLKKAADEIFSRLLSIEVPEIRQHVYAFARKRIQSKMQEDEDQPVDSSLCSVVGFPITTEIVTEILCFGFTDVNEQIFKNAKLILFALLRSKLIFKNHWKRILNEIKPILPMMTCLNAVDENLGMFVIDIYQKHSVFNDAELNSAFGRFLYCDHPNMRNIAKRKLLENLNIESDLIEIIPDEFCALPMALVTDLPVPDSTIGYDHEAYKTTLEVFKTMDRSDEVMLQSVLLKLSVLMNSRELCKKSHDDHAWVNFMLTPDMGFSNNEIIRKLTVNILYKWTVCISSFRDYLANEPKIIEFLIKTLIHFQDKTQIKKEASWLLFLLLFSDFIVLSEGISMPQFLSTLNCPFKCQHHWPESPFNQISSLEQLFGVMKSTEEGAEVRKITEQSMKFAFAFEWFKNDKELLIASDFSIKSYYRNRSSKTLKVPDALKLNKNEVTCLRHTCNKLNLETLCYELDNTTVVQNAQDLIYEAQCLMIPNPDNEEFSETLAKCIERLTVFSPLESQQKMFKGLLQIYRSIMKNLKDESIVKVFSKKFFKCFIKADICVPVNDEVVIEVLNFINCIIYQCSVRPSLMELIIKTFEETEKINLPSKIVETLSDHFFEVTMKDGKWHEVGKRPVVKHILLVLLNVLSVMPITLDEAYLGNLFDKLLSTTKPIYRLHLNQLKASFPLHVHSSLMKNIFGILLNIASLVKHLQLKPDNYKNLSMWAMNESSKNKELPWLTIAELTKEKENFDRFCEGFKENTLNKLNDVVMELILKLGKRSSMTLQTALVAVMANIMDHEAQHLINISSVFDNLIHSRNLSALALLTRKIVQNDHPNAAKLIFDRNLIRIFMNFEIATIEFVKKYEIIASLLETVIICYNHEPLKQHVLEIINNESSAAFIKMFHVTKEIAFKKFNLHAFNLLIVMMESEVGLRKMCKVLEDPKAANGMMLASFDILQVTNPYKEMVFQLRFWLSFLNAAQKHEISIIYLFTKHPVDIKAEVFKHGTILDKHFKAVHFAIDLLLLQVVNIFDFMYSSRLSAEYKQDIKSLCFILIKNLTSNSTRVKQFATDINLFYILTDKLNLGLMVMQKNRHLETSKKIGAHKCQFMIKDLCIFLKALSEWQLPLDKNTVVVKDLFKQLLKLSDWINADAVLMNCFLNVLQAVSVLEIGRSCVLEELEGKPLMNTILKKTQALSVKPPHTETNIALMKNGISALRTCSHLVEVRMMLKNSKIYQMLEVLHPQLQKNRKTTWDEVTVEWLSFFEHLSRFEDSECLPNHISLLCRIYRLGNSVHQKLSLTVIRNFSLRASIGYVLVNSDDFKLTVDLVLIESGDSREKLLVLQTLLSIASKTEQLKAKLKNSSLNRKLKDQLTTILSDPKLKNNPDNDKIFHLTNMLRQLLYPDV